jgi:hypothetical protein
MPEPTEILNAAFRRANANLEKSLIADRQVGHFLHLFHRLRDRFLEAYQGLILSEPQSAVSQPVKEAFLAMRQAAETGIEES